MPHITINGLNKLEGSINISGAKNAAVAILPASVASGGVCEIDNLPLIEDVQNLVAAMRSMNIACEFFEGGSKLRVDASGADGQLLDGTLAKNTRAGYYF